MSNISKSLMEKKVSKSILFFPIITIAILAFIIFILLIISLNKFKNDRLDDLKVELIAQKKEVVQNRVIELLQDIENIAKQKRDKTKEDIKNKVDEISLFADKLIKYSPSTHNKESKSIFINFLSTQKYNDGKGYFFAYDRTSGEIKTHAVKKLIGHNIKDLKTKSGKTPYERNEKVLRQNNGSGFFSLYFQDPTKKTKEKFEKIDYIKYLKEYDLVIGTGEYVKDITKKIKKDVFNRIKHKRYEKNGYFWINDSKGILLAHPYLKNKVGKSILDLKDINGKKIIKLFIDTAKSNPNGGFVSYYWINPLNQEINQKISFVKYFKEWDCIIGGGIYLNDLNNYINNAEIKLQKQILHFALIIFLIIFLSIIIAIYFSIRFSNKTKELFESYRDELQMKIDDAVLKNIKKDKFLQQQSKMASMGEMIGAIAHQWRQPLTAISTGVQNLKYDFKDGNLNDEDFIKEFIDKNKKTIKFMSQTIDDFRSFFRVDKEKIDFKVKQTTQAVIDMQSAQLKSHNITLEIFGDEFIYNGLQSEYQQVVLNLINNAKDALIENNIKNPIIDIKFEKNKIFICDNAGGIEEDIFNRIFEPYFTTKEQGKGTGMGLYISKMIIEDNMNAKLTLKNKNNGACFCIDFNFHNIKKENPND